MTITEAKNLIKQTYDLTVQPDKTKEQEFQLQENLKKIRTYNLADIFNDYYLHKKVQEYKQRG